MEATRFSPNHFHLRSFQTKHNASRGKFPSVNAETEKKKERRRRSYLYKESLLER